MVIWDSYFPFHQNLLYNAHTTIITKARATPRQCRSRKATMLSHASLNYFPFGPLGSTVSGRQIIGIGSKCPRARSF
jgi:hypothetical protein